MWLSSSPHPRYRLYTNASSYLPRFVPDNSVERFENEVCQRFGVAGAVCAPMARTALFLVLREILKPGQRVILSPLTIIDVVNAVLWAGGVPVFCDIERESCSLNFEKAEALIKRGVGALLLTHLHGRVSKAHAFRELCDRSGIPLVEDCAQAFGAVEGGRQAGTIGHVGIYSFGFFKNVSTWQGGMAVSDNTDLIALIRSRVGKLPALPIGSLAAVVGAGAVVDVCTFPSTFSRCVFPIAKRNYATFTRKLDPESDATRLDAPPARYFRQVRPWQAHLGLRQLEALDRLTDMRIAHAIRYETGLREVQELILPKPVIDRSHIYTYYPLQIKNRSKFLTFAQRNGRDLAAQHLRNCADLPVFREFYSDCPNARSAASELVLLPTYPRYPEIEVTRNIETVAAFFLRDSSCVKGERR